MISRKWRGWGVIGTALGFLVLPALIAIGVGVEQGGRYGTVARYAAAVLGIAFFGTLAVLAVVALSGWAWEQWRKPGRLWRNWDAGIPPVFELWAGCILLVVSASFWNGPSYAIWDVDMWKTTGGAILGPLLVFRAWRRGTRGALEETSEP